VAEVDRFDQKLSPAVAAAWPAWADEVARREFGDGTGSKRR